jgi:hypothetical protein
VHLKVPRVRAYTYAHTQTYNISLAAYLNTSELLAIDNVYLQIHDMAVHCSRVLSLNTFSRRDWALHAACTDLRARALGVPQQSIEFRDPFAEQWKDANTQYSAHPIHTLLELVGPEPLHWKKTGVLFFHAY